MRLPLAILLLSAGIAAAQDSTPTSAIRFGSPKPLPRTPGQIRLATYNLENLFDSNDDPALTGQNEDMNSVKPEAQLKGLAAAIRTLDADILAVEEVESEAVLRWFRDTYLKDLGYTHLASVDAGDERGIEQGVLSRFPINSVRNWPGLVLEGTQPEKEGDRPNPLAGQPMRFHRSPLKVEIEIAPPVPPSNGGAGVPPASKPYTLTLFIIHQKSGRFSDSWRRAEAAGLLKLITETEKANPAANIAIVGDFNTIPSDAPIQTVISGGLIDLFADLRAGGGPRTITHESGRAIDYIFINRNLQPEIVASTRFVLGTPARPAGVDYRTAPIPPGYGSDHYPVAVDLIPADTAAPTAGR
ncbi:MAG: endonuclease/exonuclease/phosphatase family protein [Phycisphaerales bacterium]|nr:endonuclease/exonuclease/phosphatase family protein [Phycisphaerales bacterium]